MKPLVLVFLILVCFQRLGAEAISDKIIATFRVPQAAYSKISVLSSLARLGENQDISDLAKSISLLEMELSSDIAYLDYIIHKYPNNSEYPKYVLDKIVVGFREGYFSQTANLKAESLAISYENDSHVNLKKIYENIRVDPAHEKEFKAWFQKFFPADSSG